mgnify:CR=1 FL=1
MTTPTPLTKEMKENFGRSTDDVVSVKNVWLAAQWLRQKLCVGGHSKGQSMERLCFACGNIQLAFGVCRPDAEKQ